MNCVDVCPKGSIPTLAIGKIKDLLVKRAVEDRSGQGMRAAGADSLALPSRWRCRRGLLENLVLERIPGAALDAITAEEDGRLFDRLLDLATTSCSTWVDGSRRAARPAWRRPPAWNAAVRGRRGSGLTKLERPFMT